MLIDPQHTRRMVHVCSDVAIGRSVAAVALRHGIRHACFGNAFAAALELLARPAEDSVLLIALDGLARPELPLLAWASKRWPRMSIWAHGLPARLNGHLAGVRVKVISLEQLDGLLAGLAVQPSARADFHQPPAGPEPAIVQDSIEVAVTVEDAPDMGDAILPDMPDMPDQLAEDTAPPLAAPEKPVLRLRPPEPAGPLLTTEELAVLLGPEDAGGN